MSAMLSTIKKSLSALRGQPDTVQESFLPDPAKKFPHPKILNCLPTFWRGWTEAASSNAREVSGDYPFRTHSDLVQRFRNLAPSNEVVQGSAYGYPVMANTPGLVFAWAGGMNQIFLMLPRKLQELAVREIGRYDPTYGKDWIEFLAFGNRYGTQTDSDEALTRWIRIAYEESLKLAESSEDRKNG